MILERLLWDETKEIFVKFNKQNESVKPEPIGFPTSFYVCDKEKNGITSEELIYQDAPKKANAYCSGKLRIPNISDVVTRTSFEVQYYKI